jgi:hypothetical protein
MAEDNPIKLCECGCGKPAPIAKFSLRSKGYVKGQPMRYIQGHSGVLNRKHGHSTINGQSICTSTYQCWQAMKRRCLDPNNKYWRHYGGRGIEVCERWLNSFENFLADMGERPKGLTLDRYPDNDGNYEPDNCRWATPKQQGRNNSRSRLITHNGLTKCMAEWAEISGISYHTLIGRIDAYGWSIEKALITPIRGQNGGKKQVTSSHQNSKNSDSRRA